MERILASIPAVLSEVAADKAASSALVVSSWRAVAGELVAERTRAVEYVDGRLIVAVEDRTWQRHLEELAPQLLAKLNSITGHGSVKFIEFRIDANLTRRSVNGRRASVRPIRLTAELKHAADSIEDAALRKNFLEAAALYLAK